MSWRRPTILLVAIGCGAFAAACKDRRADDSPAPAATDWKQAHRDRHPPPAAEPLPALALVEPVWQQRLREPAGSVLQYQAVPTQVGATVIVVSSTVGRAGYRAADGAPQWHDPEPLGDSVVIPAAGAAAILFGTCADQAEAPGRDAWCARDLDGATGRLGRPSWSTALPGITDAVGESSVVIDEEALAYQRGVLALRADIRAGATAASLTLEAVPLRHRAEVEQGELAELVLPARAHLVVGDDEIALHEEEGDRAVWRREGRPARWVFARGPRLLLVDQREGIRPLAIERASGRVLASAEPVAGIGVLAAHMLADGSVALVIRLDSSLFNDALVLYGPDLRIHGSYRLPRPERPRVDSPRLGGAEAVFLLADGALSRFEPGS